MTTIKNQMKALKLASKQPVCKKQCFCCKQDFAVLVVCVNAIDICNDCKGHVNDPYNRHLKLLEKENDTKGVK